MDETPQAELFSPTGPVMVCALARQFQGRVAKLQPYLLAEQSLALYTELSLASLMLDKIERAVVASQAYRDAQLVPIVVPMEKLGQLIGEILPGPDGGPRWRTRRSRKPNTLSGSPR